MSRLGEFANIYELLDESDASGIETGKKAQVALAEKKAAAAAALAPAQPRPTSQTGKPQGQRPQGEQRQGGNNGPRSDRPRGDRPPRTDRPREDRPPRGDRPPRPRPTGENTQVEGGENTFTADGQAGAQGAPRPHLPKGERRGPRPDRGYERRNTGDQDQRPGKREYDRRSGTGRGKEVAKGGAGKGGWGSLEDEAAAGLEGEAAKTAETETKKEGEEEVATDAAPANATDAAASTAAPEEEEPKTRTLEEFLTEKKSKQGASLPPPRQVEEASGEWAKFEPHQKKEESLFAVAEKQSKKKEKKAESSEKKVAADQVLKFQQERRERPERADKGERRGNAPRGAPRGTGGPGNQGGQKRNNSGPALKFDDASAFPTLSTKA